MRTEAYEDDILVVAWFEESRLYPQFKNSQIYPVSQPARLQGKKFRVHGGLLGWDHSAFRQASTWPARGQKAIC